ncbi:MAG TPA: tRNA (adenosine(37)-N6)-threonylcarbamoyltransferase complex ATPase subunit type 1 TsaE [Desulfomonilaceae bacterium]|nr:tRNA (adenosine(37)-N6)-threonylcarbamoyltransferase complex ATPase subunit type 1 TsaE [Desulfomonilaceae bacterium]
MSGILEIRSSSEHETVHVGEAIGTLLGPGDVILLIGELGSGKTRLAKGIISAAAGVSQDDVVSPTFTLVNRFGTHLPINHADLYRISPDRVEDIDLEDVLEEDGAIIVEWAENVRDLFENPLEICIMYAEPEDARTISIRWTDNGAWQQRLQRICSRFRCIATGDHVPEHTLPAEVS